MRKFGVGIAIKNNVEAVAFYKKVFGLELGFYEKFPDGTYQHAELKKDGEVVFGVVGLIHDFDAKKQIISFGVNFDNEAEVLEAFNMLSKSGTVKEPIGAVPWSSYCASVIDKFGVTWWISV
ncbi:MAG: VOC family protein [Clostridiales bacterium]|nr:VOC family protein [Clostridiales bacterium]